MVVLGDGAFGRQLGHDGGALLNGISALLVFLGIPESPITLSLLCEDTERGQHSATQNGISPEPDHAGTPILDSSLQNCEK